MQVRISGIQTALKALGAGAITQGKHGVVEEIKSQSRALEGTAFGSGVLGTHKRDQEEAASIQGQSLEEEYAVTGPKRRSISEWRGSGKLGQRLPRGQLGKGLYLVTWKSLVTLTGSVSLFISWMQFVYV